MQVGRSMNSLQLHGNAWQTASDGRARAGAEEFRLAEQEQQRRRSTAPVTQVKEGEWVRAPRPQTVTGVYAGPSVVNEPRQSVPDGVSPYVARALSTYLSNTPASTYSSQAANGTVLDVYA